MGHVPRSLLAAVAALLALCVIGGFAVGILPSLKRGSAADDEQAPIAGATAATAAAPVKEATPLVEPPPPPPRPKAPAPAPPSDLAASDSAPAGPRAAAPAQSPSAAPAAPPPAQPGVAPVQPVPTPPAPKLPADLPPI